MSFLKLGNGKFLVVDTVPLTPETKAEVDTLTDNGKLVRGAENDILVCLLFFFFGFFYKPYIHAD